MTLAGYYRFPTVHGDTVVFVSEDDLWTVPAAGGVARRLSAGRGLISYPRLSPDGSQLAFIAQDEGTSDVYVMASHGSQPTRVTYEGEATAVAGWSSDGAEIEYASCAYSPFARKAWLRAVSPQGGVSRALPHGPAVSISHAGPLTTIGRFQIDPARWKRYRGGMCGTLWIGDESGEFRELIKLTGNLVAPMHIGERIFFLSDHEGIGNLYSCLPDGLDLQRHTDRSDVYVRHPTTDGRRVVYAAGGDLWLFDPDRDSNQPIAIEFHSPRAQRARRFVPMHENLDSYALHPDGQALALTARGQVFTMGNWEHPVRRVAGHSGVRARLASYLTAERVALVSDEDGDERIEIHGDTPVTIASPDIGRPAEISADPTGARLALVNHRGQVAVIDVAQATTRVIDTSEYGTPSGLAWSADGGWLAWSHPVSRQAGALAAIKLYSVASGAVGTVTDGHYRDFSPSFDPQGKYLYFLSARSFEPLYDQQYFDLGFPNPVRAYLVTLQRYGTSPFTPPPKPLVASASAPAPAPAPPAPMSLAPDDEGDDNGASDPPAPSYIAVDLDDIAARVVEFPIPEARYVALQAAEGKVLIVRFPTKERNWRENLLGRVPPSDADLMCWDHQRRALDVLVPSITDFTLDRQRKTLAYRAGAHLRVVKLDGVADADAAATREGRAGNGPKPSRASGWVDLGRVSVEIAPDREWRQMFDEAWRLMRDGFWDENMSGVDWDAMRARYRPLVDRVGCRSELSDVMWELQGELGTSHAYEFGGEYRTPPNYPVGKLGCEFEYDNERGAYRITRIVSGEVGDPNRRSPLLTPGAAVHVGEWLTHVDGHALTRGRGPHQALVNRADRAVTLTVRDADDDTRDVIVKTLTDDRPARYRDWILTNRRKVHNASDGRIGYIHIPDMGREGFAEFHRDYRREAARDGLIVDVRCNGGGHVSELILEKLARKRLAYSVSRWHDVSAYPESSVSGPMLAVTDELAGSDGDIFSHGFKLLGLGPLIGKRTWGGVVGINPRHPLIDGTCVTQPEYSYWFKDVGWGIENHGAVPDIEVEYPPHAYAAGRDPQLERAIEIVTELLDKTPIQRPTFGDRPNLGVEPKS